MPRPTTVQRVRAIAETLDQTESDFAHFLGNVVCAAREGGLASAWFHLGQADVTIEAIARHRVRLRAEALYAAVDQAVRLLEGARHA